MVRKRSSVQSRATAPQLKPNLFGQNSGGHAFPRPFSKEKGRGNAQYKMDSALRKQLFWGSGFRKTSTDFS